MIYIIFLEMAAAGMEGLPFYSLDDDSFNLDIYFWVK